MDNPRLTIDQIATIKNKEFESLVKTYWGKPHLEALPYDRRTNDLDKLQERIDACDENIEELDELIATERWIQQDREETINKLAKENEDWQERIDDYEKAQKDVDDYMDKVAEKTTVESKELYNEFNDFINDSITDQINPSVDIDALKKKMESFTKLEGELGLLSSYSADDLRGYADEIEEIVGASTDGSGSQSSWQEQGMNLADNMRNYADKYQIQNDKEFDKLFNKQLEFSKKDVEEWESKRDNNLKEIDRSMEVYKDSVKTQASLEREKKDYQDEKKRTEDKRDKVKKERE